MTDLFTAQSSSQNTPWAALLRPQTLDQFVGQGHIVGEGTPLRRMLEQDQLTSLLVYGPPGCGKTTLARLIAQVTKAQFISLNAVAASTQDIRDSVKKATYARDYEQVRTILFIDEVHRFNKAQQDVLMPYVEDGLFVFIGATTENPFFAVNAPLISRAQVFAFEPLQEDDLVRVLQQALHDPRLPLSHVRMDEDVMRCLARVSEGDARRVLNLLEFMVKSQAVNAEGVIVLRLEDVTACAQQKAVVYDGTGDDHYDTVSAFIKSMRGSDPDAAVYWLAKMLYAGEDLNFIGRRIAICASEDVGNADPQALLIAQTAWDVARRVGMPEARIVLSQAVIYVATAPKSNASYVAINAAMEYVKKNPVAAVPKHLRDGHYKGAAQLGHGKGYEYAHAHPGHYVDQEYMPIDEPFYDPSDQGYEKIIKERLEQWTSKRSVKRSKNES